MLALDVVRLHSAPGPRLQPAGDVLRTGVRRGCLAYLDHPVLGPRLRRATDVVLHGHRGDALALFGAVDALKLRSSMTLFALAAPDEDRCNGVLGRLFDGAVDHRTVELLGAVG